MIHEITRLQAQITDLRILKQLEGLSVEEETKLLELEHKVSRIRYERDIEMYNS